jgi:hypothetical protein
MDLIEESNKIVNGRNEVYGSIKDRSDNYIYAGVELKLERMIDVIKRKRNGLELTKGNIDTVIDLGAYLIELARRLK